MVYASLIDPKNGGQFLGELKPVRTKATAVMLNTIKMVRKALNQYEAVPMILNTMSSCEREPIWKRALFSGPNGADGRGGPEIITSKIR